MIGGNLQKVSRGGNWLSQPRVREICSDSEEDHSAIALARQGEVVTLYLTETRSGPC